jgi:hypothetical protein
VPVGQNGPFDAAPAARRRRTAMANQDFLKEIINLY